jgi:hypothetical protein
MPGLFEGLHICSPPITSGFGERASEIGRLYQDPRLIGVAELLIGLEEEPRIRKLVAAELRHQMRP